MHADDALYGIRHFSPDECWEAFRGAEIGRLGVIIDGHPEIFPVNYAVNRGTIVFRTAEGTKLDGAAPGSPVAFEVDGFDPETNYAWSAAIKGTAERAESIEEILETVSLPIFPWQAGDKSRYVTIVPTETTGRRFRIQASARRRPSISEATRPE
ncbi:pyridoxamine 5'-phosphate oxidase family protein [Crystallibacter crystallopoietes]|uniref:pyridoxamine 5'-phosphate oxidase family protein n=1 Tax=Crystallibacter crystallopoietes TaxID=37928 RepID=UPI000698450E|nr:pyridoxamine 5'-phosphate oxidase family protein [Arthrobacter crystallopoietes]